jgi:hypothetical protein
MHSTALPGDGRESFDVHPRGDPQPGRRHRLRPGGQKIAQVATIYQDQATGKPGWLTVKTGCSR